jgi:hypothetical protein
MPEANVKLFAMARTVPDGEVRGLVDLVVATVEHHGRNYFVRKPR